MAACRATSRSASSKTTNGAFPPSSRDSRLTVEALHSMSCLPTLVEPVKLSLAICGDVQKSRPTCGVRSVSGVMVCTTCSGTPACSVKACRARAVKGVNSEGLMITVQPAAKAGPSLRVSMAKGKFHGVIKPQTPTGSLRTRIWPFGAWLLSGCTKGVGTIIPLGATACPL